MKEQSTRTFPLTPLSVIVVTAAAFLAITSGSFWIDEFWTAIFATRPTLRDCWAFMEEKRFPEIQAPLYMAYIWAWTHVFGSGEWIMRAAGAPWFIAGALLFITYLGRILRGSFFVTFLVSFSPFAWYYLNEARAYAFQLGFALAALGSAIEVTRTACGGAVNASALRIFVLALAGLCGSNVLGALFGIAMFAGVLLVVPRRDWLLLLRATPVTNLVGGILLAGLALYYVWAQRIHPRATAVGTTTLQTMIFVFYELMGFMGLGPGRNTLRSEGVVTLKPYLPLLFLFATAVAVILLLGVKELWTRLGRNHVIWLAGFAVAPLLLLMGIGVATHFRLLGRHVTPMLPVVLLLFSFGVTRAWQGTGLQRTIATFFCLLWLISSFSVRWAKWQRKDEYRGAAAIARAMLNQGAVIWWNADFQGAKYYGLPAADEASQDFYLLMNATREQLQTLPTPTAIIVSKFDTYDVSQAVRKYIEQHQYAAAEQLPAFTVYRGTAGR